MGFVMDVWVSKLIAKVASEPPATFEEALDSLIDLSEIIRRRLDAHQVKTYLVRRSPQGPVWWLVSAPGGERSEYTPYSSIRGLADYVIRTSNGLLATNIPESQTRNGPDGGVLLEAIILGQRDRDGVIPTSDGIVEARSNSELEIENRGELVDPESTLVYMPVHTDSKVSAVIGVSRHRSSDGSPSEPLTLDDAAFLEAVNPALSMACQRCVNLEKLDEHFDTLTALGRDLSYCSSLTDSYATVAKAAGYFAEASAAVLVEQIGGDDRYVGLGTWQWSDDPQSPPGPLEPLVLGQGLAEICHTLQAQIPGCRFRTSLKAETQSGDRTRRLLLFDGEVPEDELSYFSDRLVERYSEIFFQSACEALDGFVVRLGQWVADQLVRPREGETSQTTGGPRKPTVSLLKQVASLLFFTTGVERVRIYSGLGGHHVLANMPMGASDSPAELDPEVWHRLEQGEQVWEVAESSYQVVPVHFGKRLVGVCELFSSSDGLPVGQDHGDITKVVASQASWEVRRVMRHVALERINHDLAQLGPAEGQNLGKKLAKALRTWGQEIFLRPECEVMIQAISLKSGTLMNSSTFELYLEGISGKHVIFEKGQSWTRPGAPPIKALGAYRGCGITAPIHISADPRLQGVIVLLAKEAFEEGEREIWGEVARFIAVFLQGERERSDVRLEMGLFRHSALGAIQGLASSGLALADMATEFDGSTEILEETEELQRIIHRESEQLRLWRENQRFYLSSERPELRRWRQPVKPLLEAYLRRYIPAARLRGLMVKSRLPPNDFQLSLDARAFDVAISNLLDNAVKYAFENREITLGMDSKDGGVEIWVEDIGHGIPEGAEEDIFVRDLRAHRKDPLRVIAGQGLGLSLVKAIIEAHDGSIEVTSIQEGSGNVSETTPHRVRFLIQLPWG